MNNGSVHTTVEVPALSRTPLQDAERTIALRMLLICRHDLQESDEDIIRCYCQAAPAVDRKAERQWKQETGLAVSATRVKGLLKAMVTQ